MDLNVLMQHLQAARIGNVAAYSSKLLSNFREVAVVRDLLSEANAALMFRGHGIDVDLGDRPDLTLYVCGQTVCAEVKHFRRKYQDDADEQRLRQYGDHLVEYGDTVPTEGMSAWDQVVDVARRKIGQYRVGVPNILVLDSSSPHGVDNLVVLTARNIINDLIASGTEAGLPRLNGILLIAREYSMSIHRNVYFFEVGAPLVQLTHAAREAMR